MEKVISFDTARAAQRKEYNVPIEAAISILSKVKSMRPGVYATVIEILCDVSGVPVEHLINSPSPRSVK